MSTAPPALTPPVLTPPAGLVPPMGGGSGSAHPYPQQQQHGHGHHHGHGGHHGQHHSNNFLQTQQQPMYGNSNPHFRGPQGGGGYHHQHGGHGHHQGHHGGGYHGHHGGGHHHNDRMSNLGAGLVAPNYNTMTDVVQSQWSYYTPTHKRTHAEIEGWMVEHTISIYGERVPQPLFEFSELTAPEQVHRAFAEAGYAAPSPIQSAAWPILLSSRDFVGVAKTGSGKTLGFMVPAILHILGQQPLRHGEGPIVLVLAPTRELACQIEDESKKVMRHMPQLRATCCYGGVPKYEQSRALRSGVHVCIATPGRLIDMLASNATNLFRVTFLVLDEADRMLDMGFEPQIRQICGQVRSDRQTVMFSATWPQEIRSLAASFQRDFIRVHIGSEQLLANSDVTQHFAILREDEKSQKLMEVFRLVGRRRMLIFTKTKRTADMLHQSLYRAGVQAMVIHGDKDQQHRDRTIERFKMEPAGCLVATDVAARGLDIKQLEIVVNYDFPTNIEDYVHRIGRTGRAGNKGDAYTFLTADEPSKTMRELIDLLKRSNNQHIPQELYSLASGGGGGNRFGRFNHNRSRHGNMPGGEVQSTLEGWLSSTNGVPHPPGAAAASPTASSPNAPLPRPQASLMQSAYGGAQQSFRPPQPQPSMPMQPAIAVGGVPVPPMQQQQQQALMMLLQQQQQLSAGAPTTLLPPPPPLPSSSPVTPSSTDMIMSLLGGLNGGGGAAPTTATPSSAPIVSLLKPPTTTPATVVSDATAVAAPTATAASVTSEPINKSTTP